MKLFKTVMILSLALLSFGSSVAFGDNPPKCGQSSTAAIDQGKTVANGSSSQSTQKPSTSDSTN